VPSGADLKRLRAEHVQSIVPLQALAVEARGLERQVAELVNAAYGLTPEEVALMWKTAPPRMPGERHITPAPKTLTQGGSKAGGVLDAGMLEVAPDMLRQMPQPVHEGLDTRT
jgi:hypothetical protein